MTKTKTETHEYAFDIKLFAVVRVKASSEEAARQAIDACMDCMNLNIDVVRGINKGLKDEGVKITEASLTTEDGEPYLFEVDEKDIEDQEDEEEEDEA